MGKPIRQRPGETACPATPFLTASDPSAGLLNRLADLRQAVPECLLLHVGCRSRPPPALRTVNIPSPRLPHPATSQIYRGQGLALPSPCLSSLVRPARYIPSVDSGLGGPNQVWNAVVSDWPNDGRGQPMNPVYQSGYGIGSAISHGRAWAIRHFGLTKCSTEGEEPRWMPGLDSNSILNIQESGVRLLQHSFGYSVQLMHRGGLDTGTMNRLNRVIERIWESVDARDE